MPVELHERTVRLLDELPPFLASAADMQAVLDVLMREVQRIDDAKAATRANFFATTADSWLALYEILEQISVDPPDKTTDQRRTSVIAFLRRMKVRGTGLGWEAAMTDLLGADWSYEEHIPGDPTSPPANTINIQIPWTGGIIAPGTLSATSSGAGTLNAATYYYRVTAFNDYGETPGTVQAQATVGANGRIVLDWPDVAGATSYGIYRGTSAAQQYRVATATVSTYADAGAPAGSDPVPETNTTSSFQYEETKVLARKITPAHIVITFGYQQGFLLGISKLSETL
jgi:hypothetical protein